MWQVEVPAIIAICRSSAAGPSAAAAPSTPRAPAWASIRPTATRQPVVRPSCAAAATVSGPRSLPIGEARSRQAAPLQQIRHPARGEEVGLPAFRLVGEIGPLAGDGAFRARGAAAGAPGQVVGEVEEQAGARPDLGAMALQPHQLGDLHLGRHHAADMARARDGRSPCTPRPRRRRGGRARRWCRGRVRRVLEIESGAPSRSRTTSEQVASKPMPAMVDGSTPARSTASRTEAHTQRQISSDAVLGMIGKGPHQADRPLGPAEAVAGGVEHARPGAAGPDIDANHQPVHGLASPSSQFSAHRLRPRRGSASAVRIRRHGS